MKMKPVNHLIYAAAALLAVLLAVALPGSGSVFAEDQVFKVGISGPLTGPQAAIGKDDENGARMAIDKVNAQGIVADGRTLRFELVSVG